MPAILPPPSLKVRLNDDESIVSLKVTVIADVIATSVALFAGLVDITAGAVTSCAVIIISSVTGAPSRFTVVLPLYKTVPDVFLASRRKYLLSPFSIEKVSVIDDCPATETSLVIVDISGALIVNEIL